MLLVLQRTIVPCELSIDFSCRNPKSELGGIALENRSF